MIKSYGDFENQMLFVLQGYIDNAPISVNDDPSLAEALDECISRGYISGIKSVRNTINEARFQDAGHIFVTHAGFQFIHAKHMRDDLAIEREARIADMAEERLERKRSGRISLVISLIGSAIAIASFIVSLLK